MNQPKYLVGDVVSRTKSGGQFSATYQFTIKSFTNPDGSKKQFAKCHNGSLHALDLLVMVKPVPRPWMPVMDDKIQVTNSTEPTHHAERVFFAMDGERYVCHSGDYQYFGYLYARPIPEDTTITLANGVKIELSLESYNALVLGAQA